MTEPMHGYTEYGYVHQKPKKKLYKRPWFWVLTVVLVITAILVAAIAAGTNDALNSSHTIVYKVNISGPSPTSALEADITYSVYSASSNGVATVSDNSATLPWTKTIQGKGSLSGYSVIATNQFGLDGLECSITIDGKVVSSDTGGAAVVTCAG
jgi:hypothetical protein